MSDEERIDIKAKCLSCGKQGVLSMTHDQLSTMAPGSYEMECPVCKKKAVFTVPLLKETGR